MIFRLLNGAVVLGGAAIVAVALYWVTVEALGVDYKSVFQGGLLTAAMIGLACLASDLLPNSG